MNQWFFISDKAELSASLSTLQDFDQTSRILTERFGFKVRNDRHGIFDFFYHEHFKENIMEYSGGELRVKNPSDALLERMVEIAQAFPSAKVLGEDGAWHIGGNEARYPEIHLPTAEDIAAAITEENTARKWSFLKIGMAVCTVCGLAVILDTFVF